MYGCLSWCAARSHQTVPPPHHVQSARTGGSPDSVLPTATILAPFLMTSLSCTQGARVAVLVCGPQAMVDEVKRLCGREHFGPLGVRVRFEVHTEVFQL